MIIKKHGCLISLLVFMGMILIVTFACPGKRFKLLSLNHRVHFYGEVRDQNDQPVPGAKVTIQFSQSIPWGGLGRVVEGNYTTNSQGRFAVRWKWAEFFTIRNIEKKGFEYSILANYDQFSWRLEQDRQGGIHFVGRARDLLEPNADQPIEFRLRKRGETTHLKKGQVPIGFKVKEAGLTFGFDMVRNDDIPPKELNHPSINGEPLCCDILCKGLWNPKNHTWSVVLSAGTPGGGLMISDQLLYVAPETGYQPTLTLGPTGEPSRWEKWGQQKLAHPGLRYLYLRSRTPFVYARIDLGENFDVNDRPFVRKPSQGETYEFGLPNGYLINPYGDRILDEEPDLSIDVRLKLEQEVRAAYRFHVNGRPPKPDIPKLIKDSGRR